MAVCADRAGRQIIMAVNRAAEQAGVRLGQSLADALSLRPDLTTQSVNLEADLALLDSVARWAWRFSPLVGRDGADGLWVDITGCAHLFGGERAILDDIRSGLRKMGLSVRAGVADTAGAAWAMARYGGENQVVPAGGGRGPLNALPMAALRVDAGTVAALSRVGLRRIGDLAGIARASLASRFGRALLSRLDQAFGDEGEALAFLPHTRPWRVRHAFIDPVGHVDIIARALDEMLARLCQRMGDADKGCRTLILRCRRVDGSIPSVQIGTVRPSRDPVRLARLFTEKLADIDAGFGIDVLVLSAPVVEPLVAEQTATAAPVAAPKADLADRLANRLGMGRVARAMPMESHLPERAWQAVGASAPVGDWTRHGGVGMRPLRLLTHPAPIKALAPPLGGRPGDPPGSFAWGVMSHHLCTAQGPERISPNWWRKDGRWSGGVRDYWRVEDREGLRFWIYHEIACKRWFLHGCFV